jgi:hypothetical protein
MSEKTDLKKSTEIKSIVAPISNNKINITSGQSKNHTNKSNSFQIATLTGTRKCSDSCEMDELRTIWGLAPAYNLAACLMPRQGQKCRQTS